MDLQATLRGLFLEHEADLGTYAWVSEDDRWAELVFCLLSRFGDRDPESLRDTVATLGGLGLLDLEMLAGDADPADRVAIVLDFVLRRGGFSASEAARAARALRHVAEVIRRDHGGKLQRLLRRHGEALRDELVRAFGSDALAGDELGRAVSHWLQNALSLPISLESPAVAAFCARLGVTPQELWRAADELGLNLAVVDDLVEMDSAAEPVAETGPVSAPAGGSESR
jgi:hypothetical protein